MIEQPIFALRFMNAKNYINLNMQTVKCFDKLVDLKKSLVPQYYQTLWAYYGYQCKLLML